MSAGDARTADVVVTPDPAVSSGGAGPVRTIQQMSGDFSVPENLSRAG
jgi:hypothetical protein